MKTKKRAVGDFGEDIITRYLLDNNFLIVERNYLKKWGELDIIAENKGILHFIEVKSRSIQHISRETVEDVSSDEFEIIVSRETDNEVFSPEENVHTWKQKRMSRAIRTFLLERKVPDDKEFEVDVAVCLIDFIKKKAYIRVIDNIVLE